MALARTLTTLEVVKATGKIIPVVGTSVEAIVDLISQGCKAAEGVQSNKEASVALSKRAALLAADIVRELQKLDEDALKRRTGDLHGLLLIVQEIKSSHQRHASRQWLSRTWRKDEDKEEIKVLSNKLDETIERFSVLSLIGMKGGLDAVLVGFNDAKAERAEIRETQAVIKTMVLSSETNSLLNTLRPVDEARYDVQSAPPGCLQGTRGQTIRLLVDWATNNLDESIFWLSGLAGLGKTTVVRTVCDELAKLGVLGAAFFISRSSAERTNPQSVVRSLAHQLAHYQPDLCAPICDSIRKSRMIATQAISFQIPALICEPIRLAAERSSRSIVLIIDALDECDVDEGGRHGGPLLPLLLAAFCGSTLPIKLLVTSRLERSIQLMFAEIKPAELRLHEVDKSSVRTDIQLYLEYNFREIAIRRMNASESSWPGKEVIDQLTDMSGGLFIFAATVIKHVRHPRHIPAARLKEVLAQKSEKHRDLPSSFDDLDKLYTRGLQSALGDDSRYHDKIAQRLRTMLGVLIVLFEPLTIASLAILLDCDEELLRLDLESLSAVILVPEEGTTNTIHFFHASFQEFLSDAARCPDARFLMETTNEFHELISVRFSELHLQNLKKKKSDRGDDLPDLYDILLPYIRSHENNHRDRLQLMAVEKVVHIQRQCLQLCGTDHPDYLYMLSSLTCSLLLTFSQGGDTELLLEAIQIGKRTLRFCLQGNPDRDEALSNLANALLIQYKRTGGADVLAEAIRLYSELLELRPQGHPSHDDSLSNLANALLAQFNQTGDINVLMEAISLYRAALELHPRGNPRRNISLINLGNALLIQASRPGNADRLTESIRLNRESLELCPPGHPNRSASLSNLANALKTQFERTGGVDVLHEAIRLHRESLELCPTGHPDREKSLSSLANVLLAKYQQTGRAEVLVDTIRLYRESLELCPRGHPSRYISLDNLGNALLAQFRQTDHPDTLIGAIRLHGESLELCPLGHPSRDLSLNNFANALKVLFEKTGNTNALAKAISLYRESLDLRPQGHPSREATLINLAAALKARYEQTEDTRLLTEAIYLYRESLNLHPRGHPNRDILLGNFANALKLQFEQTGEADLLTEVVCLHRESLELRPRGHPFHDFSLSHLADALHTQFKQNKDANILEEAIYFAREALKFWSTSHQFHRYGLERLASFLENYASETKDPEASAESKRLKEEVHNLGS